MVPNAKEVKPPTVTLTAVVPEVDFLAMKKLARDNDRSLSAEVREALRLHLLVAA